MGTVFLNRSERETWLMPLGHLLDQIEIHKQMNGLSKPYEEHTIDDVIPLGL